MATKQIRVQVVLGSQSKDGNCASMAAKWLEGVREEAAKRGYEVVEKPTIVLPQKKVQPCTYCGACGKNPAVPACVIKDDVNDIIMQVLDSDLVLHATPIWYWSMTGAMKCYLDRFTQLYTPNFGGLKSCVPDMCKGLTFATVANSGDPNHESMCRGALHAFREFINFNPIWRYAGDVSACSGFKGNKERCQKVVELGKASVETFLA